jgi:DNA-binding transcriptional MerR regulator
MTLYSLGEVARLVNVAPYRIAYAISVGALPDTEVRFNNKRCFSQEDVDRIARHFRHDCPNEGPGVTARGEAEEPVS